MKQQQVNTILLFFFFTLLFNFFSVQKTYATITIQKNCNDGESTSWSFDGPADNGGLKSALLNILPCNHSLPQPPNADSIPPCPPPFVITASPMYMVDCASKWLTQHYPPQPQNTPIPTVTPTVVPTATPVPIYIPPTATPTSTGTPTPTAQPMIAVKGSVQLPVMQRIKSSNVLEVITHFIYRVFTFIRRIF